VHIPDGFLNTGTVAATYALSAAATSIAARKVRKELSEEKTALLGVTAAFIFAAQMVNFPIVNGTSGHLIGGMLAALIAGPFGGFFIITSVLIIQALLFADGGITALGANVFNMAVVGTIGAYYIYRAVMKFAKNERLAIAVGSWTSVFLASIACAVELSFSGKAPFFTVVSAMAVIHALIGIGEAIITLGIVEAVRAFRPDIFYLREQNS
jgi:cobalt/nickel transport system permease protein